MEAAVGGNMEKALSTGVSTFTAAGAIAIGIAVVSSLAKIVHRLRKDYKNPRRKLEN